MNEHSIKVLEQLKDDIRLMLEETEGRREIMTDLQADREKLLQGGKDELYCINRRLYKQRAWMAEVNEEIDELKAAPAKDKEHGAKTMILPSGMPDVIITQIVNALGDRFAFCKKVDGCWRMTYVEEEG